jgi:alpha-tubulin suppressor-like RCC1 family protein
MLFALAALAVGALGACTPTNVLTVPRVVALGGGYNAHCAVYNTGGVWCWGAQLGAGTSSANPVKVTGLPFPASKITDDGGPNSHICVLVQPGQPYCWGSNNHGQLGPGFGGSQSATPVAVPDLVGATDIAAGGGHTCAVFAIGTMKCWGDNTFGQLGNGTFVSSSSPVQVGDVGHFTQVVAGRDYTCGLTQDTTVFCWGSGPIGAIGVSPTGVDSPVAVQSPFLFNAPLTGVRYISGGDSHVCAILSAQLGASDGQVVCWGLGIDGELGNGATVSQTLPVLATGMTGSFLVGAGQSHSCATSSTFTMFNLTNQLVCWGRSPQNAKAASNTAPSGTSLLFVRQLHAGANSTCALVAKNDTSSTDVECFGSGSQGQLGQNSPDTYTPIQVLGLP